MEVYHSPETLSHTSFPAFDTMKSLRDTEHGKTAVIIGTGDTISEFDEHIKHHSSNTGSFILAVNNAWRILDTLKIDSGSYYYITGHNGSIARLDFYKNLPGQVKRIVPLVDGIRDAQLFPDKWHRIRLLVEAECFAFQHKTKFPDECHALNISDLTPVQGGIFSYARKTFYQLEGANNGVAEDFFREVSPNQKYILAGGTSVGVAIQIAIVMGAKQIELYGVPFDNEVINDTNGNTGLNYDPRAMPQNSTQGGSTSMLQRIALENLITKVRSFPIQVDIKGRSNLFSG